MKCATLSVRQRISFAMLAFCLIDMTIRRAVSCSHYVVFLGTSLAFVHYDSKMDHVIFSNNFNKFMPKSVILVLEKREKKSIELSSM